MASIINISYARVSSSHSDQLVSLCNQTKILTALNPHGKVISHIGSGAKSFSVKLLEAIKNAHDSGHLVQITVASIDRLTRNFSDLDVLRNYVKYIKVLDENIIYDVATDLKEIACKLVIAVNELDQIRLRAIRGRNIINAQYNIPSTRDIASSSTSYNVQNTSDIIQNTSELTNSRKIEYAIKRCVISTEDLLRNNVTNNDIYLMANIINTSVNLTSISRWNELFTLLQSAGYDTDDIKRDNETHIKDTLDNGAVFMLSKSLLKYIIYTILQKKYSNIDEELVGQFVTAYVYINKMCEEEELTVAPQSLVEENRKRNSDRMDEDPQDSPSKRSRLTTDNIECRLSNTRRRCAVTCDNLKSFGVENSDIQLLTDIIHRSMNLVTAANWEELFELIRKTNYNLEDFKLVNKKCMDDTLENNTSYKVQRSGVHSIVCEFMEDKYKNVDMVFVKEFVNAQLYINKLYEEINEKNITVLPHMFASINIS